MSSEQVIDLVKEIDMKKGGTYFTEEEAEDIAAENFGLIHFMINKLPTNDIDYDDLFDAGQYGYAKAIKTFDKSKNIVFSTYACHCIRNELIACLKKEQSHVYNTISLQKDISTDDGKTLELEEIISNEYQCKHEFEDHLNKAANTEIIMTAIGKLTPEEQRLILHRFGLGGKDELLQKDIADSMSMSQANISKMEKRCFKKLKFFLHQKL